MPLIRFGNNARPEKAADLQMRNGATWGSFRILQRSPSKPNSFLRGRSSWSNKYESLISFFVRYHQLRSLTFLQKFEEGMHF